MPTTRCNGIDIYYQVHGQGGHPLMLIRGIGSNAGHWYEQIPALSEQYRVIAFDNRGVGRSSDTGAPYTISMMGSDVVGLMDALEIEVGHVLGLSMGGMIAQELAIAHPERVRGLILASTHCGGDHCVRPLQKVEKIFMEMVASGSDRAKQEAATVLFAKKTLEEHPEVVRQYGEISLRFPTPPEVLFRQWEAVSKFDSWDDLPKIQAPTLVLTGDEDALILPENSRILAERIPNARMEIIQGGGHQVLVEKPEVSNRAILRFLDSL